MPLSEHWLTTGFATDLIAGMYPMLTREFTERAMYWTPAEVLVQATSESAEVIRLAGKRNPQEIPLQATIGEVFVEAECQG